MVKPKTGSYLAGRTRNRAGDVDYGTSDGQIVEYQEEVQSIAFNAIPTTSLEHINSNPFQYRKTMDEKELEKLEQGFRTDGITSAILGRYNPDDPQRVQIAYGHRRITVVTKLNSEGLEGFSGYPVLIKDLDDKQMRKLAINENWNREDPSIIDTAYAFKSLLDTGDYTQEEAADYFGVSRGTFREILDLTKDNADIQDMVQTKDNTVRAARDIRKISGTSDPDIRAQVIQDLLAEKITVTQVPAHIETLRLEKARRIQDAQERIASSPQQEITPASIILSNFPISSRKKEDISNYQPDQSNITAMMAPSEVPSERTQPSFGEISQMTPQPIMYEVTQQKSVTLTEQSRLRTLCKNVEDYGKRLNKRMRTPEPIPQEEIDLVQRLYQLTVSQTEKFNQ